MGGAPSLPTAPSAAAGGPPIPPLLHSRALEYASGKPTSGKPAIDFNDASNQHLQELQGKIDLAEAQERASESRERLLRALVPDNFEKKGELRNERLRRANTLKNRIWGEWQKQCLRVCDEDVKRYWICKEEQGLSAPLNCRRESEAMKDALRECGRDEEAFALYRARRVDEIEAQILKRRSELASEGKGGSRA